MAFFQYLVFDGENLPLPDSYEVELEDVEADSGGETEAGTTQRDVVRHGVAQIPVSFSVTAKWLKKLAGYAKLDKISVQYFDVEKSTLCYGNENRNRDLRWKYGIKQEILRVYFRAAI